MKQIYQIDLDDIRVDKYNVRRHERDTDIGLLADNIKKYGQMQPIVLMGVYGKPPYQLIVGQRRFLAHNKLKRKKIDATFVEKMDEMHALLYSLAENLQRSELNFTDKSDSITRIYNLMNKNLDEVCKVLNLHKATVIDYIKVNDFLDSETKELIRTSRINKSELKRAITIAKGDKKVLKKHLSKFKELSPYDQKRAVEYIAEQPNASFEKAIEVGKKPKIESVVIVRLPEQLDKALDNASTKTLLDKDEIALKAIEEWLNTNGFLN